MSKKIAIITARGGSKRIPGKNLREFCGRPIIAYPIEAALKTNIFDEVMVSTDDENIARTAKQYGASIPFMRSDVNANDFATTEDVLLEVIENYRQRGQEYDFICCLYPTAPFVTSEKILEAMNLMEEKRPEQILPMVAYSFPPQRCNFINDSGYAEYKFPEFQTTRSQDLEKWYHDAGQFYIYNVEKFIRCEGKCTEFVPMIISELEVQDIDDETDWKLAEMKYKLMLEKDVNM